MTRDFAAVATHVPFVIDAHYRVTRAFRTATTCDPHHSHVVTLVTVWTRIQHHQGPPFCTLTWEDRESLVPNTHWRTRKPTRDVDGGPS